MTYFPENGYLQLLVYFQNENKRFDKINKTCENMFTLPPKELANSFVLQTLSTLHLNKKNLSFSSSRDSKNGLDTIDPNLFSPTEHFCPNTSSLGAIYDSSKSNVLKMVQMKNRKNFTYKKPAATPTFCKRNFSRMPHIDFILTLLSEPSLLLSPICTTYVPPGFEIEE